MEKRWMITASFVVEGFDTADDAIGEAQDILADAGLHDPATGECTAVIAVHELEEDDG